MEKLYYYIYYQQGEDRPMAKVLYNNKMLPNVLKKMSKLIIYIII